MEYNIFAKRMKEVWNNHVSKETVIAFISTIIAGLIAHLYIFTHNFVNSDGIYYYFSNNFDMTVSGRWALDLATSMSGKFTMPAVIGMLSIFYMAVGNSLLVVFFHLQKKSSAIIASVLIAVCPVVTSTFTYMFTADAYFLAYLLSIIAAFAIKKVKNRKLGFFLSAICLCFSLGIYQAYGAVTIVLLMFDSVTQLFSNKEFKEILVEICRYLAGIIFGFVLYFLFLLMNLQFKNLHLLSYQGIDEMGESSFWSILLNVPKQYAYTFHYLQQGELFRYNIFTTVSWGIIVLGTVSIIISIMLLQKNRLKNTIAVVILGCLPIAINLFNLISDKTVNHLLMKMSWMIPIFWIFSLCEKHVAFLKGWLHSILAVGGAL